MDQDQRIDTEDTLEEPQQVVNTPMGSDPIAEDGSQARRDHYKRLGFFCACPKADTTVQKVFHDELSKHAERAVLEITAHWKRTDGRKALYDKRIADQTRSKELEEERLNSWMTCGTRPQDRS